MEPSHSKEPKSDKQRPTPRDRSKDSDTPNMDAARDWDKAQHVKAAMQMGATKEQARRHAERETHED